MQNNLRGNLFEPFVAELDTQYRIQRAVAADVFAGNKNIKSVFLPESVTEIPAGAFKNCTALEAVFAEGIKSIGTAAFQNCSALKNYYVINYKNNALIAYIDSEVNETQYRWCK